MEDNIVKTTSTEEKILRTKQIEDLDGATLVSEGIDANYMDMVNYSVFAVIKLTEE